MGSSKYLIGDTKVRLDLADNDGKTPLHHAVYYIKFHLHCYLLEKEKKGVIRLILEEIKKNFSQNQQQMYNCINAKDSKGKTPLMYSVQACKVDTVKILLEYRADTNAIDKEGCTPLDLARSKGFQQIIELLNGSNSLEQESSSDGNNPEEQKSASVGSYKSYEQQDSNRESNSEKGNSLSNNSNNNSRKRESGSKHKSAEEGASKSLNNVESNSENQEIFSRSSSTSGKNDNDNLSEENCSRSSSPDSQEVEHTASNDISEESSDSPRQDDVYEEEDENSSSQSNSSPESLDELQNDIINRPLDDMGGTILHLFVRINHHNSAIDDLINSGARLNAQDNRGFTPLHFAVIKGYHRIVNHLMWKGADVSV